MKQRAKLGQAFFSDAALLILDEPTANLDEEGVELYHRLMDGYTRGRIVIVGSNDEDELVKCTERIYIPDYK